MTDAESDETQASARSDKAAEDAAAETSAVVGADDETTVVPDVTQRAHALAWSTAENPELGTDNRHPLPRALKLLLVAVGVAALALAGFVVGQRSSPLQPPTPTAPTAKPSIALPAKLAPPSPPPPAPKPPPVDDDEYVAMALSPSAIDQPHHAGFGTAGNQDEANRIAISECRSDSGNDDCLLIDAGRYHGCVSYAIDPSGHRWASGSGDDPAEARTKARNRLDSSGSVSTAVQCSDPPGLLKPFEMTKSDAAAPDTQSATPVALPSPAINVGNPAADQLYLRLIQQIPGTVISDPATALAGGPRVCTSLVSRGRAATSAEVQANDLGVAPWQIQAIINAATTAYCPAYAGIP
ncbi:DUF732 domain-containing protein [Mycobacterium sp.]|uniref:DUF732 domain-containing protein n=1 Tax=Mycobacterium sp. TaxID=1785 RepID=UPI003BB5395B